MGTESYPPPAESTPPPPPPTPEPVVSPPPPAAPAAPGKGWAIASLICSLLGLIPYLQIGAVLGIIFGFVAKNQMKGLAAPDGAGLAKAGIIIGFIALGLYVICCVIWVVFYGGLAMLGALTGSG